MAGQIETVTPITAAVMVVGAVRCAIAWRGAVKGAIATTTAPTNPTVPNARDATDRLRIIFASFLLSCIKRTTSNRNSLRT